MSAFDPLQTLGARASIRMMRFIRALFLIFLPVAACRDSKEHQQKQASLECDIALNFATDLVADAKGRPLVFATDDDIFTGRIDDGEWWIVKGDRAVPAVSPPSFLVQKLKQQGNRNAVTRCPSVRRRLDQQRIAYGEKAVAAATSIGLDQSFKATVMSVSLPVVSAEGRQALLASSSQSGPLAGAGFLQFLQMQPDGKWRVVGVSGLWIS